MNRSSNFSSTATSEPTSTVSGHWIWGLFVIGILIRLIGLGEQCIWIDEAFAIQAAQAPLGDVLMVADPTPPLYYTLLHFWIKMVGNNATTVRLLSVLFGGLSIPAIYFTATKLLNRTAGLTAAVLLTLSPANIYLSQLARTYSLLLLLSIVSMYLYLSLLERPNWKRIAFYVLCTILLVYCHVFAWFIVIAQNLHFLYRNRLSLFTKKWWWIVIQTIPVALFFPWFFRYITTRNDHGWIDGFHFYQLRDLLFNVFVGPSEITPGLVPLIPFVLLLLWRRSRRGVLYVWLLAPIVVPALISIFITPIFTPKYIFYITVPLYILLGDALTQLRFRRTAISVAALFFLGCTINQQIREMNDPWDRAIEYVQKYKTDEPILLIMDYETLPFTYNYDRELFNNPDFDTAVEQANIYGIKGLIELKQRNAPELILIKSRFPLNEEHEAISAYLGKTYALTRSETFSIEGKMKYGNKITVEFLIKNPPGPTH